MFLIFLAVIKTLLNYVFSKYVEYLSWIYKELHMEIKELKQVEVITDVLCDVCNQSTQLEFGTLSEPYRVCRRVNILRDYSDEKTKLYPRN